MTSESKKSTLSSQVKQNLQRVYDEALDEDVPEEFIKMIRRLKAEKQAKSDGK